MSLSFIDIAVVVRPADVAIQIQCTIPPEKFANLKSQRNLKRKYAPVGDILKTSLGIGGECDDDKESEESSQDSDSSNSDSGIEDGFVEYDDAEYGLCIQQLGVTAAETKADSESEDALSGQALYGFTGTRSALKRRLPAEEVDNARTSQSTPCKTNSIRKSAASRALGSETPQASIIKSKTPAALVNAESEEHTPVKSRTRQATSRLQEQQDSIKRTTPRRQAANMAIMALQRQQNPASDSNSPWRNFASSKTAKRLSSETPRAKGIQRRNLIANEMKRLEDSASDGDSDAFICVEEEEYSSTDEEEDEEEEEEEDREEEEDEDKEPEIDELSARDKRKKPKVSAQQLFDRHCSGNDQSGSDGGSEESEQEESNDKSKRVAVRSRGKEFRDYFDDLQESSRFKPSTNSLQSMMPHKEYKDAIRWWMEQEGGNRHSEELEYLRRLYRNDYRQWAYELNAGFSLLFYGYGSKRELLEEFLSEQLSGFDVVVINGFFPTLNYRSLLSDVARVFVGEQKPPATIADLTKLICRHYSRRVKKRLKPLVLLCHNIDGSALRSDRIQASLAQLASVKSLYLIASIDNLQAGLMWSAGHQSLFNFVHHDLTTFEPYHRETSFEDQACQSSVFSRLVEMEVHGGGRQQTLSVRAVMFVMKSLNATAKSVFKILARHQLSMMGRGDGDDEDEEEEGDGGQEGNSVQPEEMAMTYVDYLSECKRQFLVSSDVAFRNQLTEFIDHRIILTVSNSRKAEAFFIPMNKQDLQSIQSQI